jgi:hypothetical protein
MSPLGSERITTFWGKTPQHACAHIITSPLPLSHPPATSPNTRHDLNAHPSQPQLQHNFATENMYNNARTTPQRESAAEPSQPTLIIIIINQSVRVRLSVRDATSVLRKMNEYFNTPDFSRICGFGRHPRLQ